MFKTQWVILFYLTECSYFNKLKYERTFVYDGGATMGSDDRLKDDLTDSLFEAILLLETKEECYRFFQDIATVAEIKSLAQRLEVARMLEEDITYTRIADVTGASSATISRVKRCLNYGADGYKMILERLEESKKESMQKEREFGSDNGK